MAAGDVHVVTIRRGLDGVVVPSKLYSILAAGRPVWSSLPRKRTQRALSAPPVAALLLIPTIQLGRGGDSGIEKRSRAPRGNGQARA